MNLKVFVHFVRKIFTFLKSCSMLKNGKITDYIDYIFLVFVIIRLTEWREKQFNCSCSLLNCLGDSNLNIFDCNPYHMIHEFKIICTLRTKIFTFLKSMFNINVEPYLAVLLFMFTVCLLTKK